MDLLIAAGSVPLEQRDIAPATGTPQWATDGNPGNGISPTDWPAWMFNMMLNEMITIVDKAGLARSLTDWTQLYQAINKIVGPGRFINQLLFTASGTYIPTTGTRIIRVRGVGAGGPGGYALPNPVNGYASAAGGGGSGAECDVWIDVSAISSIPVTMGAPAAAIASEQQNAGGNSSFGSYVTLGAGVGGGPGISVAPSSGSMTTGTGGGFVSFGDSSLFLFFPLVRGGSPGVTGTTLFGVNVPGYGATSSYGTPGQITANGAGGAGGYYGAGGGGGGSSTSSGNVGGAGCPSLFIVDEYS